MPTIKGPIKITGGFNAMDFLKGKMGELTMKLPFKATGWKSSKNAELVTGKKEAPVKKKEVKKAKKKKGFFNKK